MTTDPKPQLGRAAIEANIVYYNALCRKHINIYKDNKSQLKHWQKELDALLNNNK